MSVLFMLHLRTERERERERDDDDDDDDDSLLLYSDACVHSSAIQP